MYMSHCTYKTIITTEYDGRRFSRATGSHRNGPKLLSHKLKNSENQFLIRSSASHEQQ